MEVNIATKECVLVPFKTKKKSLSGAVFGAMRLKTKHRKLYRQFYLPWAVRNGSSAKPLMNVYWEKRWDQDVTDLRKELNLELLVLPQMEVGNR